jgi:hypothetical protein
MTATRPAPVGKTMSYAKAPLITKTNTALADWMTDHTAKPRPIEQDLGRDQMLRLANTGDRLLHYTGTHDDEKGRAPGVYVSTRPLSCLDDASFQATLVNASHPMTSHAVIGFYIDNSSVRRVDADKYELLGLAEKSVGFDCLTGSLSWTLNCKYNELTELETIGEGEMVSAQARPRPDGSCEVTFSKSRPTEMPTVLGKVQVGFISPSELFPVVEFRLSQEASRSSKGFSPKLSKDWSCTFSKASNMSDEVPSGSSEMDSGRDSTNLSDFPFTPTSALSEVTIATRSISQGVRTSCTTNVPGDHRSCASVPASDATNALGARRSCNSDGTNTQGARRSCNSISMPDTLALIAKVRKKASMVQKVTSLLSHPSHAPRTSHTSAGGTWSIGGHQKQTKMTIMLSFEPRNATDLESLSMIFQVLFNAIVRQYTVMHDHGNLSGDSYVRLKTAVGHAEDLSNQEVGAKTASGILGQDGDNDLSNFRVDLNFRVQNLQRSLANMTPLREQSKSLHFEPLVVEYLILERFCATDSRWDGFSWLMLRQFGYWRMKAKIESLWAFVETHEKMVMEMEQNKMGLFQDVAQKLNDILKKAKEDMGFIEDINPRRFFFIKHFLALRMLLTMKLGKLEQIVNQGWVMASDVEELKHGLEERLAEVESFFPRIREGQEGGLPNFHFAPALGCDAGLSTTNSSLQGSQTDLAAFFSPEGEHKADLVFSSPEDEHKDDLVFSAPEDEHSDGASKARRPSIDSLYSLVREV